MNFAQFAYKNVKRNIKSYLGYFFSILISSALLFSFNMFINHPNLDTSTFDDYLMLTIKVCSIIVYVFLFFFVFYSVSVFLKGRNKEFGILYSLGISNKQIQKMIFIENFIINALSSTLGVIVGLIFSKIVLIAISNLLGIEPLKFYIPTMSMIATIIYFMLLSLLISLFISFVVKEDKVLKLLKGSEAQKPEPKFSLLLVILCIILLTWSYYKAVTVTKIQLVNTIGPVTFMTIIATYLLFSQLSVFVIKAIKNNKKFYKKNTNMLCISNLYYKMKDNTRMFFLIAITSAVAFTAIGAVYAYWKDQTRQVELAYPQAINFATNKSVLPNLDEFNNKDYIEKVNLLEKSLKEEKIPYYKISGEIKTVFSKNKEKSVKIIKESKYEELAEKLNQKTVKLKDDEAISLTLVENKKVNNKVVVDDNILKVVTQVDKSVMPAYYDLYVVKDDLYDKTNNNCVVDEFTTFDTRNYMKTLDICKNFENTYKEELNNGPYKFLSKSFVLDYGKITFSTLLFLTIFIGLIFFVTASSFLYNKIYMDCQEDKEKYMKLNKIGLTYKEIRKISTIEIGILFLVPYIIAVIHSTFALLAVKNSFNMEVASSAYIVMGSFFIVLIIYFLVIRRNYLKEINEYLNN